MNKLSIMKGGKLFIILAITPWLAFSSPNHDMCDVSVYNHLEDTWNDRAMPCGAVHFGFGFFSPAITANEWLESRSRIIDVRYNTDYHVHDVADIENFYQAQAYYDLHCPKSEHCEGVEQLLNKKFSSIPTEVRLMLFGGSNE